jgi:hypothetical protein
MLKSYPHPFDVAAMGASVDERWSLRVLNGYIAHGRQDIDALFESVVNMQHLLRSYGLRAGHEVPR